jgi:hypothetical protein
MTDPGQEDEYEDEQLLNRKFFRGRNRYNLFGAVERPGLSRRFAWIVGGPDQIRGANCKVGGSRSPEAQGSPRGNPARPDPCGCSVRTSRPIPPLLTLFLPGPSGRMVRRFDGADGRCRALLVAGGGLAMGPGGPVGEAGTHTVR